VTSTELARQQDQQLVFLNPETGEILERTADNAGAVLIAARNMDERLKDVKAEATDWLAAEAERLGKKTLHGDNVTLKLNGGPRDEYDAQVLEDLLRSAGCPEERIREVVVEEITYKVDKRVLKQLAGANKDYAAAAELARRVEQKPYYAAVETRRGTNG
jgi:hypothetical protein